MSTIRIGMAAAALACTVGLAHAQTNAPGQQNTTTPQATAPAQPGTANQNAGQDRSDRNEKPPLAGANSFTEDQAKERIARAGFEDVQNLKKDDNGIWRGQARKSGQQVGVALDYRGNVVQQ